MKAIILLSVVWVTAIASAADAPVPPQAELVSVKRIWNKAPHNGFPDLIRWRDKWLCCFREGERHVGGADGKIRVLVSTDGDAWESAALLAEENADLRDASISEMPDGRLMLVCGASFFDDVIKDGKVVGQNATFVTRESRVAFSTDGRTWTPLRKILEDGHWLWRVTWHKGVAYGLSKTGYDANPVNGQAGMPRRGFLYSSTNGIDWNLITEWGPPVAGTVSETRLRFTPDDEMIALVRPHFIGTSKPPYKEWTFRYVKAPLLGPNFLRLADGSLWASTRHSQAADEADKARSKKPTAARTVIAKFSPNGDFQPVLTLPSGGDTGYAGLVWNDGLLWVAYYSGHESTGIYLAKVKLPVNGR